MLDAEYVGIHGELRVGFQCYIYISTSGGILFSVLQFLFVGVGIEKY